MPVPLTSDRLAEASRVVSAAFEDDPVTAFLYRDLSNRRGYLWANAATLKVVLPLGATYTTPPPRVEGVAAFCPPGCYPRPWWVEAWQLWAGPFRMPLRTTWRALRIMSAMSRVHLKEPHWYLQTLAVHPDRQRQGVGSFLISPTLECADRDTLPVYLETTKEANVTYYRRFGFEVVEELTLGGALRIWTMLRPPRT
jgi:ribosomal protein S18 acetylase RimI-like enzyme